MGEIEKEQSHKYQLMELMLDCTDAILYSVNRGGRITAFNRAASETIQLRKGVGIQIGDYWPALVSGDTGLDLGEMERLLAYVLAGNSYRTTVDLLISKEETITYSVQTSPIINGEKEVIGAVLCAHDITTETRLQRESAERALMRTQELERWNQFYDMLLSVLAHDLRQPLSTIILSADLITKMKDQLSMNEIVGIMESLRNTSTKSMEMLEGLLYWVESNKLDFNYKAVPLNLYELIEEANMLFLYDQHKKGVLLQNNVVKDVVVMAHYQMILFVLRNLFSNATKYAYENSFIKIWVEQSANELTIVVQDNGKGMCYKKLSELFSIKKQTRSSTEKGGAGMALTIAQDMIKKMNGHIRAESVVDVGTTFFLTLPVI